MKLPFNTTKYESLLKPLSLPHSGFKGFISLRGTPNIVEGVLTSSSTSSWDVIADIGVENYVLQTNLCSTTDGGNEGTYGFLFHASIGANGLSGVLIGIDSNSGRIDISVGHLHEGNYVHHSSFDAGFKVSADYQYKFVVQGSTIIVMINGYRRFAFSDNYYSGSKIIILNNSGTITYKDLKIHKFKDNIANYAINNQGLGINTYAKIASISNDVTLEFNIPNAVNATNFRLVRRTSMLDTAQSAQIYLDDIDYGTWSINQAEWYGDAVYLLTNFTTKNNKVVVKISPKTTNIFKASHMWLIYTISGTDYISDSVYFGDQIDTTKHKVTGIVLLSNVNKHFMLSSNGMLLTTKSGEKVVWAKHPNAADKMEEKVYEDFTISTVKLSYRLYLPTNYDKNKAYPLLVFLHGAGERGSDNLIHITGTTNPQSIYQLLNRIIFGEYADKFIVVAPQCPNELRWVETDWTPGKYDFNKTTISIPMQLLISLLYKEIFANYSVDLGKVYGAGLSMGGFGIIDLAMRKPKLFAAIIHCAGGADASQYKLLKTTAIRAYHSTSDASVGNKETEVLINALTTIGADAKYFEVNNIGHESWIVAFEDADLLTWMLSKNKK